MNLFKRFKHQIIPSEKLGEEIIIVLHPGFEGNVSEDGRAIYRPEEVKLLMPYQNDPDFLRSVNMAKKIFNGSVIYKEKSEVFDVES